MANLFLFAEPEPRKSVVANYAENEDPQGDKKAFPPDRQWQGQASFCRNEPFGFADESQAQAESTRHHDRRWGRGREDSHGPRQAQLLIYWTSESGNQRFLVDRGRAWRSHRF